MISLGLHFDFRAPDFGPAPADIYRSALEQVAWGERNGFSRVTISSHHGCDDNYGPSPIVAATAVAARTAAMRIMPIIALPLYHPIAVAEDVAVLDLISGGRIDLMVAAGYVPEEFAMFGASMAARGAAMEEGVNALRAAWTGEPFTFRGEKVLVRPRPFQANGPMIIMAGDSRPAARRAARMGVPYAPMKGGDSWVHYAEALAELGRPVPPRREGQRAMFVYVTEDPDAAWEKLAPHLMHVNNSYARWMVQQGRTASFEWADSIDDLRRGNVFEVLTPQECVAKVNEWGALTIDPVFGGLPDELSWPMLELLERQVLPHLQIA